MKPNFGDCQMATLALLESLEQEQEFSKNK